MAIKPLRCGYCFVSVEEEDNSRQYRNRCAITGEYVAKRNECHVLSEDLMEVIRIFSNEITRREPFKRGE